MRGPYVNGPYAWGNGPYKLTGDETPCDIGQPIYMRGPYVNGPYAWGNGPYKLDRGPCRAPGPVYMEGPYVNGAYACGNGPYDFVEPPIRGLPRNEKSRREEPVIIPPPLPIAKEDCCKEDNLE
jgi:hypothetical protein